MQIIRGKIKGAERVVIYGPEGVGKSTLASHFPNPVFIDIEYGTRQLDVARFPTPTSWSMLMQQVEYVHKNPSVCDTLVIDTIDRAEQLATEHILAKYNKQGIEEFGYGNGYTFLTEELGRLLNRLEDVMLAGVHVVIIAHAQTRKFEQPGEIGAYDKWELKLLKRNAPMVREWADNLFFVTYKTYVVNVDGQGAKKGRNIAEGGKRVMYTTHHPTYDAKNRHGLPDELDLDFQHIAHVFLPREQLQSTGETSIFEPLAPAETPPATAEAEAAPTPPHAAPAASEPAPATEPTPSVTDELEAAGVPRALADLMRANNVTVDQIMDAVAFRGYFPEGTPFANLPPDFVEGVLIGAWDQVLGTIRKLDAIPF